MASAQFKGGMGLPTAAISMEGCLGWCGEFIHASNCLLGNVEKSRQVQLPFLGYTNRIRLCSNPSSMTHDEIAMYGNARRRCPIHWAATPR